MTNVISLYSENSTNSVLEYLTWIGGNFQRINEEDTIKSISIVLADDKENIMIDYDTKGVINLSGIENTWYRKGDYTMILPVKKADINNRFVEKFLLDEWDFVKNFLHQNSKSLGGHTFELANNKLLNLKYAKQAGLCIPTTIVTTKKSGLSDFIKKHAKVITKPIHNAHIGFKHDGNHIVSKGTQTICIEDLTKLDDTFCPLLAQVYTEKEIELRVFFIEQQLYPMAIFSQLDEQTRLDYRNYNNEKPNRNIPYQFTEQQEISILQFIKLSGLNTGSIDLISTKDHKLVFLEVNPTGQFGWVSDSCNYYLEEKIAHFLLTNANA
jgi:ATP-GRASP peptide maturase of grasp-with-spasm system